MNNKQIEPGAHVLDTKRGRVGVVIELAEAPEYPGEHGWTHYRIKFNTLFRRTRWAYASDLRVVKVIVLLLAALLALSAQASAQQGPRCDPSIWVHVYHPKRLVVIKLCAMVTGTIVDASKGRHRDGARHEADGDGHFFLKLDAGQEEFLNAKNLSNEDGNLVFEPVCMYRVTQKDAVDACKNYKQDIVVPPVGTHVRMTGSHVLDTQHGHKEIHPVTSIEVIP